MISWAQEHNACYNLQYSTVQKAGDLEIDLIILCTLKRRKAYSAIRLLRLLKVKGGDMGGMTN